MTEQVITIDLAGGGAADDVPVLREGPALDLPEGAVENPDGSVTLTFVEPVFIKYTASHGGTVQQEEFGQFTLRRLKGRVVRKILDAASARTANLTLALCTGISEQKLAMIFKALDAPEMVKAHQIANELLDANGQGLPERAVRHDDGTITLPLLYAATDGDGEECGEIVFRKLKAEALVRMQGAKDMLTASLQHATGMTPKAAAGLIDDMDGADLTAAQRVIGFLSGIGRRSGG